MPFKLNPFSLPKKTVPAYSDPNTQFTEDMLPLQLTGRGKELVRTTSNSGIVIVPGRLDHAIQEQIRQYVSLNILRYGNYQLGAANLTQIDIGNCWSFVIKGLLDSEFSAHYISHTLELEGYSANDSFSFSFPSNDPEKRSTVEFNSKQLASYSNVTAAAFFQGASEQFARVYKEYRTKNPYKGDNEQIQERIKQGDIAAILDGGYEQEMLYHLFKKLTSEFLFINYQAHPHTALVELSTVFKLLPESIGCVSFHTDFIAQPVRLNGIPTPQLKVHSAHAYYLKTCARGIATLMNPHKESEQIHLSIEELIRHAVRIWVAKLEDFHLDGDVASGRKLPLYVSAPSEKVVQQLSPHFEESNCTSTLYPYLPATKFKKEGQIYYAFRLNNEISLFSYNTGSMVPTVQRLSNTFLDEAHYPIYEQRTVLSRGSNATGISYFKGYVGVTDVDGLEVAAPKIKLIAPRQVETFQIITTSSPFSLQVFTRGFSRELNILPNNTETSLYFGTAHLTLTSNDFKFFYDIENDRVFTTFSFDTIKDLKGVCVTCFHGDLSVSTYNKTKALFFS